MLKILSTVLIQVKKYRQGTEIFLSAFGMDRLVLLTIQFSLAQNTIP